MSKIRKKSTFIAPKDPFTIGYLCGLIDGEGCFNISIYKGDPKIGFCVCPQFMIHLTKDSKKILDVLRILLNSGNVRSNKNNYDRNIRKLRGRDSFIFRIARINDCIKLAEFLDGKLMIKQKDLEIWKEILDLIKNRQHLTKNGILWIAKLRDGMNNPSKSRRYKDYDWFKNFFSQN